MHIIKKYYKLLLFISFAVMFFSQVLLRNPKVRPLMSTVYKTEQKNIEMSVDCGYVGILVSNPSENLFIMQNGEKVAALNKKDFELKIFSDSVVEIYGVDSQKCVIKISYISDNLNGFYDEIITVDKNIAILGRFFIK